MTRMYTDSVFWFLYIVIFSILHSVQGDICIGGSSKTVTLKSKTSTSVLRYGVYTGPGRRGFSCHWLIEPSSLCESLINIQVVNINRAALTIFNGRSTGDRILWSYGSRPRNVTSSSLYVLVKFGVSHRYNTRSTFEIQYKTIKGPIVGISPGGFNSIHERCFNSPHATLLAKYGPNYIQSPGFGQFKYVSSLRCAWLILSDCYAVIKITFTDFLTASGFDFVRIYDGSTVESKLLGAFSGSEVPNPVVSTTHSVLVTFITDKGNTFRGFKFRYENELLFPVILSDVEIIYNPSNISVTVCATSHSPIRSFQWLRNGKLLYDDTDIVLNSGSENCNTTNNKKPQKSTLSLTSVSEKTYGTYKVSVQNDVGFSERLIQLNQPSSFMFGIYNISMNSDNMTIQVPVTFISSYGGAKWFKEMEHIDDDGHKYQTSISRDSNLTHYIFQLEVFFLQVEDFVQYKLSVTSEDRTSEINIPVQFPDEYIPTVENYRTNIGFNAKMSVSYTSNPSPKSILWKKDSTVLVDSDKYRILNNTNTRITTLEIFSVNETDFGSYKLSITNAAGTRISHFVLNKPEVFPVIVACNQSETIDITCTIVNCKESFLPWIHSINGTTVRHIAGHVTDLTNTLTISQCTGEDIGRYTCVTEQEFQNGTKMSVSRESSLLSVYASPIIDRTVNIVIEHNRIQLRVNVSSKAPLRLLRWFRNDVVVTGAAITERPVEIAIRGTIVTTPGYVVELLVSNYNDNSFGRYKVYVANEIGVSEHYIQVDNPEESIYVMEKETSVVTNVDGIAVSVTFFAFPEYDSVSWTNIGTGTTVDSSQRHTITTTAKVGRPREFITQMKITDIKAIDYTQYNVSAKNKVGHLEYFVTLKNPKEGVPEFQNEVVTTVDGRMAVIAVNFTSNPAIHSVTWFKDDIPLLSGLKYKSTTQEQSLQIAIPGSVEIMDGYHNQLTIEDVNKSDFGRYRVQLQNSRGYTQKSVSLTADCDIKSTS